MYEKKRPTRLLPSKDEGRRCNHTNLKLQVLSCRHISNYMMQASRIDCCRIRYFVVKSITKTYCLPFLAFFFSFGFSVWSSTSVSAGLLVGLTFLGLEAAGAGVSLFGGWDPSSFFSYFLAFLPSTQERAYRLSSIQKRVHAFSFQ